MRKLLALITLLSALGLAACEEEHALCKNKEDCFSFCYAYEGELEEEKVECTKGSCICDNTIKEKPDNSFCTTDTNCNALCQSFADSAHALCHEKQACLCQYKAAKDNCDSPDACRALCKSLDDKSQPHCIEGTCYCQSI